MINVRSRWTGASLMQAALLMVMIPVHVSAAPPARCDFDGDGQADPTVARDAGGGVQWWIQLSATSTVLTFPFGTAATDTFLCADVDGDGLDDAVVWRPGAQAQYFARLTAKGSFVITPFGTTGDQPLLGDFDHDGTDDFAVYRPGSPGTFWVRHSTDGAFTAFQWGAKGDNPYVSDRDGDGVADYLVQRSDGTQWAFQSGGSVSVITWGLGTDLVSPLNYGGLAAADTTVIRYEDGTSLVWYTLSDTGTTPVFGLRFGVLMTDFPTPGDFDGDGLADPAVFRTNGQWYVLRSTLGMLTFFWGANGDYPVARGEVR